MVSHSLEPGYLRSKRPYFRLSGLVLTEIEQEMKRHDENRNKAGAPSITNTVHTSQFITAMRPIAILPVEGEQPVVRILG